ncbi:MAG: hypothetical protein U0641_03600 [Anaerolineae bacterium]
MVMLTLTDDQVLDLVNQLPPDQKRAALLALAEAAHQRREERLAFAESQLRRLSGLRGLNWDAMSEDERDAFVDELMHED